MRPNPYKKMMFDNWLKQVVTISCISFILILVVVIIVQMGMNEQIYYEGIVKSIPLLNNEKMKKLGDAYIELNQKFEQEMMNMEINYANRTNKRGERIFYGVNGKENSDEIVNNDYVNGIESIKYVKGKGEKRKDGESNFIDMVSFLSVALGSDIDKYSEEQLLNIFEKLFYLTHTFEGTSTELYPCEHGCRWCKYYCGDYSVQGEALGDTVPFYRCDEYMGEAGQYGLMYDPFLINKKSNYRELTDLASDETYMRTAYQYKDVKVTYSHSDEGTTETHTIVTKGDRVVASDDEIFSLYEPDGFCLACSGNRQTFTTTTRKFAGCITHVDCHCINAESKIVYRNEDDETGHWVDWHMDTNKGNCNNYSVEEAECNHDCECEDECTHECADPELLDTGYYVCQGHPHFACPGHIIVCCFGHTNLNLEIKIMYYEDMIDTISDLLG